MEFGWTEIDLKTVEHARVACNHQTFHSAVISF